MNIEALIGDLALIMILAAAATIVFKLLKQPVVLGYIVAGFLASPHFSFVPNVVNEANIKFWAQIGIIVLLFSLGLEFSFKKLINAGGSAIVTALILMLGMMATGFLVGKTMMDYSAVNSIFLGALLSTSSTTIIIKALTDLNMRQKKFVPKVLAVLIVEDLFAVVMLVVLSSIAINKTVAADEMLISILKLSFFLIIWFLVGVFLLPSLFNRFRRLITDEMLLIIAMGLCFLMVIFSVESGFSMALGAFVMGSILAGTTEAERMERVVEPVKNLFGAVFFISVGMMVDPNVIVQYWDTILLLGIIVVIGMIVFGTFGMLATGQSLKVAMESGFTLTQIGEFSFIIATLGTSLKVLDASLYPIIVTVSVITTFFTPFFIKSAEPCYRWVERRLPSSWQTLLQGYSANATTSEKSESRQLWSKLIKGYLLRLLLYSVVIITLIAVLRYYLIDVVIKTIHHPWGKHLTAGLSLLMLSPFLLAIIIPTRGKKQREELLARGGRISWVPIVVLAIVSIVLALLYIMTLLYELYSSEVSLMLAIGFIVLMSLIFSPLLIKRIRRIESRFVDNMNQRENRRTGKGNKLVSDLHLAYMTVGYKCPFVGEKLKNADLRRKYGVNVASIQRGETVHPVPGGEMRIFPGDLLGVIGNDEQIATLLPLVEAKETSQKVPQKVELLHFAISENSPLTGMALGDTRLQEDYGALLVAVQRDADDEGSDENFITPTPSLRFLAGDILWIVGEPDLPKRLK